jgi:hypothetical protein
MSFQDPLRQQRPVRYPAFPEHEDGHQAYRQRPPWDEDQRQSAMDTGAPPSIWGTSSERALRNTGAQPTLRDSSAQRSLWDTGAQRDPRATGAQPSMWDTGAQRSARTTDAQHTLWDTGAQRAARTGELPLRSPGAAHAAHAGPARNGARRPGRGLLPGGIAGFLAAAVALGIANLVAAFVRPQASPIIAVGGAFIDRTPSALKNFAVEKFGENDKNMLLLGMYVTIALLAVVIGILAWRQAAIGVAGIGLFGLFGAFVAITRPESHVTDVIPSIVGGIAGIATILWLVRSGMPRGRQAWARRR